MPSCGNRAQVDEKARDLLQAVQHIELPGQVTCSLGIAFTPASSISFAQLFDHADQAM